MICQEKSRVDLLDAEAVSKEPSVHAVEMVGLPAGAPPIAPAAPEDAGELAVS
jgi:hypothetical protein